MSLHIRQCMDSLLSGEGTDGAKAEMIRMMDGASDGDIMLMVSAMKRFMEPAALPPHPGMIDMCGTGGDRLGTFNVSTAASFVAVAAGARVAKHGNRSSSGGVGSADIFEMLGVDIAGSSVSQMMENHRICFLFAQRYHPAVRHVAGARRLLGRRTVFNVLGPLCNPAGVRCQLVGVSDRSLLARIPRILEGCGADRAMCVMGGNGLDELSTTAENAVCVCQGGKLKTYSVAARDLGVPASPLSDIIPRSREDSLRYFVEGVCGTGCDAVSHATALNAGAGLVVAGIADTIAEGFETCMQAIRSGEGLKVLRRFVREFGDEAALEGA